MFTKRKFLTFPIEKQHKKCAEMLRRVYEHDVSDLLMHYNEVQGWMGYPQLEGAEPRSISNRYHQHLSHARISLGEHGLLPRIRQYDKINPASKVWPIAIYLDHIRSAHNVGSILRTVEAYSLGCVYFSSDTPFIDHNKVKKTSMGTSQHVTCFRDATVDDLPTPIIALETSPEAIAIHDFLFPETFSLVMGNEEYGCSENVLKHADYLLEIPLRGRKNSLNVANAFAIAAAEITCQKTKTNERQPCREINRKQ